MKHLDIISYNDLLVKDASSKEAVSYNDAILKDAISGGKLMTLSDELNAPLLQKSKSLSESESGSPARSESSSSIKSSTIDDKGNRSSRRAKVLNLGKKVIGKLDGKRRMVVEKMPNITTFTPNLKSYIGTIYVGPNNKKHQNTYLL